MSRWLVGALLLLVVAACGPPDVTHFLTEEDGNTWHGYSGARWPLPEARQGRRDPRPLPASRPIWSVLANGNVRHRGIEWPLIADNPVEVEAALMSLRIEHAQSPDDRGRRDEPDRRLGLYAHRAAPWRAVLELLHVARDDLVGLDDVDVFVRPSASLGDDEVLSARLVEVDGEAAPRVRTELTFVVREVTTPPHVQIRVDTHPGEEGRWPEAYDFMPGSRLLSREPDEAIRDTLRWFDWANGTWDDVTEVLADAQGPASIRVLGPASRRHVFDPADPAWGAIRADPGDAPPLPGPPPEPDRVEPDQDLAWAYVVTAMDLLLERGIRTITFPDEGFALEFDRRHVEPRPPEAPLASPLSVAFFIVVAVATLLAYFVAWAGMREVSRRDRRGRARPAR